MGLTSAERILLFLSSTRPGSDMFGAFDQDTISHECGIGRTHVPRSMRPLLERSLVEEARGRSPGKNRLVKRYSITQDGQREASSIADRIRTMRLSLVGPDGLKNTTDPVSILSLVNTYLSGSSRPPLGLPLLLSLDSEVIDWGQVLELSSSQAVPETFVLPQGWEVFQAPEVPAGYVRRPREESRLSDMIDSEDVLVVVGKGSIGRRTLVAYVLREKGMKGIWVRRGEKSAGPIKAGADVLVVLDDPAADLSPLKLQDGTFQDDPRGDEWAPKLRSMRLTIIGGPDRGSDIPSVTVGPIDLEGFVRALEGSGLDEAAIGRVHAATGGSPAAFEAVMGMDGRELSELASGSVEGAIFKVLLRMGRSKSTSKDT